MTHYCVDLHRWLLSSTSVLAICSAVLAAAPPVPDEAGPPPLQPLPRPAAPADPNNLADDNAAKVYIINVRGVFGRDFSPTPLADILKDACALRPEFIVIKLDCDFDLRRLDLQGASAFDVWDTEKAAEMATMLTDKISRDKGWEKKPRLVMWISKALGPACFFPWVCRDIYFTGDALHGGIGSLDRLFADPHAFVTKGRSLRMARAKGLAEKGGYDPRLITAMCRSDYILSVTYVDGVPQLHEDLTGNEILSDGGNEENGRMDKLEDVILFRGNDVLILDAERALRLGVSKGTANILGDLLQQLGIARNYRILDGKSDEILVKWSRAVNAAERELSDKWREVENTPIKGDTPDERNRGRSKRITILNEMKPIVQKYGEAINARLVRAPTQLSDYDSLIEQLKQQMRFDKPVPSP